MEYKYRKNAGALNELAAVPAAAKRASSQARRVERDDSSNVPVQQAQVSFEPNLLDESNIERAIAVGSPTLHAQSRVTSMPQGNALAVAERPTTRGRGLVRPRTEGARGMFFYTVQEGQRVRVLYSDGRIELVSGPKQLFSWGKRIEPMERYVAHPGEFLIVRFRDGRQEHRAGPANVWFDPREHLEVSREDALQLSAKEAVVVYSREGDGDAGAIARRIVHGPATFVPAPGEWLHTFSWHGSRGANHGYEKVPNALVFQKLWLMPDQMYHDVTDVRTADDAVLTIRLMLFFELLHIETMLDSTHDPIGDFVNAASSDVVDFVARHDLESFKKHTDRLNELAAYPQLVARAAQCGYRINKVVYRGYGAPESLQRMHDEAIESRTRLLLERATQEQAQDIEDAKQTRAMTRAAREREEQRSQTEHQIEQERRRREAEISNEQARREFVRAQAELDARAHLERESDRLAKERAHFDGLRALGVDLTKLLAERRPDQVLEVRGGAGSTHLHVTPEAPKGG